MHIIKVIPFLLSLTLAIKESKPRTTNAVATANEHQKPEAAATASTTTEKVVHKTPPHLLIMLKRKHPHVFLEVIKIKERVLVDKHHLKELSREAIASEQLFRVHHDGSRTPLRSRIFLLSPKHGDQQSISSQQSENEELSWFDKLALALHLDHFWPRFLFSLCTGFLIVASGLGAVHLVCYLLGYESKSVDDEYEALLNPNTHRPGVINASCIQKSAIMQESII